ncbi:succinyl-diaminopimelate desuccinylase [Kangiella sediminilitoris]|uniref:Succinyl-diaminopimelate desuccinylase n=1 Tax=Kangiella sediminilitoris TaxID=1144748 RepID=A0A1B3BC21_9GAMM|nr:succinyl-diaminopimelate desuccinylase [Kangiella sediminilitoris]AOE50333.1 succinyl-diaminopimelate desuccinylase [Kangiella sediminilitoris]
MFKSFKGLPDLPYAFASREHAQYQDSILELVQELIRIPSITPEDSGCSRLIAERLQQSGFLIEYINKNSVTNLWACRDNKMSKHPAVVFSGHTDVVPPGHGARWDSDPFTPTLKEGYIYGRGASDMKGSLAAMVVAIEQFVKRYPHHRGNIGLMLTSDEEGEAVDGTQHIVNTLIQRGQKIDYAIVGEPTTDKQLGDSIRIGRRGSINARINIKGKQGHVGYPEQLINPIHNSSKLIHKLANKRWDMPSRYFPSTSFQLVKVHSESGAMNVTPASLEMVFNFRYSPRNTFNKIKNYVERKAKKYGLEAEFEWEHEAEPYITRHGKLRKIVQKVIQQEQHIKTRLTTAGGISDGRYLKQLAGQVIELGPCNKTIHQANERVSISELNHLCKLYYRILEELLIK